MPENITVAFNPNTKTTAGEFKKLVFSAFEAATQNTDLQFDKSLEFTTTDKETPGQVMGGGGRPYDCMFAYG